MENPTGLELPVDSFGIVVLQYAMTKDQLMLRLRKGVQDAGSQKAYAAEIGVRDQLLSMVLMGRIDPPPSLLAALELRRVVTYEPVKP